jgi:replicative DNA helicase
MLTNEQNYMLIDILNNISTDAEYNEVKALGAMLNEERFALTATKFLEEKHFYYEGHRLIFKILKESIENHKFLERALAVVNTINEEDWQKLALNKEMTVRKYISYCRTSAICIMDASFYFAIVKEHYVKRQLLQEYISAIQNFADTTISYNIKDLVGNTVDRIKNIIDITSNKEVLSFKEECLKVLEERNKDEVILTGFRDLDKMIHGFRKGQFIVIGAATSMGKSAFAINIALNICNQNKKIAIWSFEMNQREIIHRIFAIRTEINSVALKNNNISEEHYNSLRNYIDNTEDNIIIRTDRIKNINDFYLECRSLKINKGVEVIIIDYLQLIHLNDNYQGNRVRELEQITNNLKNIATDLDIVIISLSQLSREISKRSNKIPLLSDLRDSGSIEQDADIIMFLCRMDILLMQEGKKPGEIAEELKNITNVIVAKNRDGGLGLCSLKFNCYLTKYFDVVENPQYIQSFNWTK